MASSLRHTIEQLTHSFTTAVLAAIRAASLDELLEETGRGAGREGRAALARSAAKGVTKGGRLMRRSAEELAELVDRIVALLAEHPEGLRAEQIREELGLESKELPRPLSDGLAERRITKSGQKRATTYFAGKGHAGVGKRGRRAKGKAKRGAAEPTSTNGAPAAS
jgi:hypothetical protein